MAGSIARSKEEISAQNLARPRTSYGWVIKHASGFLSREGGRGIFELPSDGSGRSKKLTQSPGVARRSWIANSKRLKK
jgi:hypothetical protein